MIKPHPFPGISRKRLAVAFCIGLAVAGCGSANETAAPECTTTVGPSGDVQNAAQTAFIDAQAGSTVCFEAGTYSFKTELSIETSNVTVRGAGQGQTVFDFSKQDLGAYGMEIFGDDTTLEALTIKNTPGDGVRALQVKNIAFRNVTVGWDARASMTNGAYALYPVQSEGVLVDGCEIYGSRDAGIYVGQSKNVLVQNNDVHDNVAGIEFENTTDAEMRNNHAHDNVAGLLAFNLPNLPIQDGKRANIHDNLVENNNQKSFAVAGTIVSYVPSGIGVMILSADDNEVHQNTLRGNQSVGVLIVSYYAVFLPWMDPTFDPYPQGNFVHDNVFSGNGLSPKGTVAIAVPTRPVPDIVWDGCTDPKLAPSPALVDCMTGGTYYDADLCGKPSMPNQDLSKVSCTHDTLPVQH